VSIVTPDVVAVNLGAVNLENAWVAYDDFVLEPGGDPSAEEVAWWMAQDAEYADVDLPTPTEPTRRQHRPMPTRTGLADADVAGMSSVG
jgi:hypothetical protein